MLNVFKSSIFKGFLFVVFMVCDGMSGVSVGKSITISDCQDFFCKTEDDLKGVVSITFKNQSVDDKFCKQWYNLGLGEGINKGVETIRFKNCRFCDDSFYIFCGLPVKNLVLNNCGILPENIMDIFFIDRYVIESINLSNNKKLGKNPKLFCENLEYYIFDICNPKFILKGSKFTPYYQNKMRQLNEKYVCCDVKFDF